jgi:hypothetical protein
MGFRTSFLAAAFLAAMPVLSAIAQSNTPAPCLSSRALVDSARADAMSVLASDRPLVQELRQEQGLKGPSDFADIHVVSDRYVCSKLAGAFEHMVAPGQRFVVLKIGPMFYARDPDQRRGTGVFVDTGFRVLMRLGAALPPG